MKHYDLVIVGAGPAGMSAALFAKGDGLDFRLVENGNPCGYVEDVINTNFTNLENYLGLYDLSGTEAATVFRAHLVHRGIPIHSENILQIKDSGGELHLSTEEEEYGSKTLILATGTKPRKLSVNGLERVTGKIHYGINSDLPDYSGEDVLVVGGRNSGCVTAVRLWEMGIHPVIVEKAGTSSAKDKYLQKVRSFNIPYLLNTSLVSVTGQDDGNIESVVLDCDGCSTIMRPRAIFGCIGSEPNNSLARSLNLSLDGFGYVVVDRQMRTSHQQVFAAGDLNGGVKMIVVAAGEGATAEYYANAYVRKK